MHELSFGEGILGRLPCPSLSGDLFVVSLLSLDSGTTKPTQRPVRRWYLSCCQSYTKHLVGLCPKHGLKGVL